VNNRRDLVQLISNGASEADIIYFFVNERQYTPTEAYEMLDRIPIEFGAIRRLTPKQLNDGITPERRRYLQDLSLSDR
jgi:hypothetical protein